MENNYCRFIFKKGDNKYTRCGVDISELDEDLKMCPFHHSVIKRFNKTKDIKNWAVAIKPLKNHCIYEYKYFPCRNYNEYYSFKNNNDEWYIYTDDASC